jgi:hypothetical protein
MTSAILGARFISLFEGVGGWMARCAIFGRPEAANRVLIERSRTFFLEVDPEGGAGESDLAVNDELRAVVTGGFPVGVGDREPPVVLLLTPLSPIGMGSVGLSGRGVLLHLLPCL